MSQNKPNWQFCLFDKDGQVLSDGKMTAQTKISVLTGPKRTKKRTKSAAREKGFKILLMVRSKKRNALYKTKSDLIKHIFTISCRNTYTYIPSLLSKCKSEHTELLGDFISKLRINIVLTGFFWSVDVITETACRNQKFLGKFSCKINRPLN